nr:MAG TPA: hypothetical protein [Caudoviricetes sp.]DAT86231.1 MAG TPA: hypothetical protein [Caudoviricetes sp.]
MSSVLNTLSSIFIHIFINILCINKKTPGITPGEKQKESFIG